MWFLKQINRLFYGKVSNSPCIFLLQMKNRGNCRTFSPAIVGLKHLTDLYLHYNLLFEDILREIANLTLLSGLYLNVNNFSGEIPSEIGNMGSLQVNWYNLCKLGTFGLVSESGLELQSSVWFRSLKAR
uniref:Uncharacterized protein n=1 Tax=Cucumis melo TaxID=3656 RepID=A0A9I9DR04_CUCME